MPGGNNLIETMMYVKVFAKGYYPAQSGNTIYYRVFSGVVSHVAHADKGSSLTIAIQCLGVLQFLASTYQDLNPSLASPSPYQTTPMTSRFSNFNAYDMLAATFAEAITFDGFQLNSISQARVNASNDRFSLAVNMGYIQKWNAILLSVIKDTRILGNTLHPGTKKFEGSNKPFNAVPINSDQIWAENQKSGSGESAYATEERNKINKKS